MHLKEICSNKSLRIVWAAASGGCCNCAHNHLKLQVIITVIYTHNTSRRGLLTCAANRLVSKRWNWIKMIKGATVSFSLTSDEHNKTFPPGGIKWRKPRDDVGADLKKRCIKFSASQLWTAASAPAEEICTFYLSFSFIISSKKTKITNKIKLNKNLKKVLEEMLNVEMMQDFSLVLLHTHWLLLKCFCHKNLLQKLLANRAASTQMTHLHNCMIFFLNCKRFTKT